MADIDIRRPSTPKPTPKPTSKPPPNPASTHTPKPTLSKMLFDRDMTYSENTSPFLSHFKSQPPASFSPSFSSGPSESYTRLSRSSSNSSLLSSYSATTSTSATSTDDNESGDGFCLVGILKKPRRFRNKSQKRQDLSHGRHQSSSRNHHDANHGNGHHHDDDDGDDDDGDDDTEDEQGQQEDDDDEWGEYEDDESECEVLFERNVTFAEPLATDIITGTEVSPSSRSRLEWTALRARACLERERAKLEGAWTGREEEQDEEQQEAPRDARGSAAVQRGEEGCGEEEDGCISKRPCEFDLADDRRHWQNDSGLGRGKEGKRRCGVEAEVEHLVLEITETVVRQAEQR